MADLSELVITGAQKSAASAGDGMAENLHKGAQLALANEEVQMKKAAAQKQAADIQNTKVEKFTEALFKVQNFKDPAARKNYLKNYIPKVRDMWGLQDTFSDESLESLSVSDEDMGRAYTLNLQVMEGTLAPTQAAKIYNDPAKRSEVPSTPPELRTGKDFTTDEAFAKFQDNQARKAQMAQSASQFATGQAATDRRDFDNKKVQLTNELNKENIPGLNTAVARLDRLIPGGLEGWEPSKGEIPGVTGKQAKLPMKQLSGKALEARQAAQSVANQLLKARSGGAVSDGEATRLLNEIGMSSSILEDGSWKTIFTGTPTSEAFVNGMRSVQDTLRAKEQNFRAGYGSDVYDSVQTRTKPSPRAGSGAGARTAVENTVDKVSKAVETIKAKFPNGFDSAKVRQALARTHAPEEIEKIIKDAGGK